MLGRLKTNIGKIIIGFAQNDIQCYRYRIHYSYLHNINM